MIATRGLLRDFVRTGGLAVIMVAGAAGCAREELLSALEVPALLVDPLLGDSEPEPIPPVAESETAPPPPEPPATTKPPETVVTVAPPVQPPAVAAKETDTPSINPGDRLDVLVAQERHEAAARIVLDNRAYFRTNWKTYGRTIGTVAEALNAAREPAIFEAYTSLSDVRWPVSEEAWPGLTARLQAAQQVLAAYDSHPFLRTAPYRSKTAEDLERRIAHIEERIARFAVERFVLYDHIAGPSFFDAWPLPLDGPAFMTANFARIEESVAGAPSSQLARFLDHYPPGGVLTGAALARFGRLYQESRLAEIGESDDRLRDHVTVWRDAQALGLDLPDLGGLKIAAAAVGAPGAEQAVSALDLDPDLPQVAVLPPRGGDEAVVALADAGAADVLVLISAEIGSTTVDTIESEDVPSVYLVGAPVLSDIDGAAAAEIEGDLPAEEDGSMFDFVIDLFGASESEASEDGGESELAAAPDSGATYADYAYARERVEVTKHLSVTARFVDLRSRRERRSTLNVTDRRMFVLARGLRADDPGRAVHLAAVDSEAAIADWESAPTLLPVSLVLERYMDGSVAGR